MEEVKYIPKTAEQRIEYMRKLQYMAEAILDRVKAPKLGYGKDNYSKEQRTAALKIAAKYLKEEEFKDKTPAQILEYLEKKEIYRKEQAINKRKQLREIIGKRGERSEKQDKLWEEYKAAKRAMKEAKKKFNMAINETDKKLPIYFKVKEKEDPLAGVTDEKKREAIKAQIREEKKIDREVKAMVKARLVNEIERYQDLDQYAKANKKDLLDITRQQPTYSAKEEQRRVKRVESKDLTKTGIAGFEIGGTYKELYKTFSQQLRAELKKEQGGIPKPKQESGIPKAKEEADVDLQILIADLKAQNTTPYSIIKTIEDRGFVLSDDLKNQLIDELVKDYDTSTMKYKSQK